MSFQFQTGAIKRQALRNYLKGLNPRFNSKLVRLKDRADGNEDETTY